MNNFTEGTLSNLIFDFQRSNYALNMLKDKVTEKFNYIDKNLTYDDLQVYFISLVRETMKYYNDMLSIIDLKKDISFIFSNGQRFEFKKNKKYSYEIQRYVYIDEEEARFSLNKNNKESLYKLIKDFSSIKDNISLYIYSSLKKQYDKMYYEVSKNRKIVNVYKDIINKNETLSKDKEDDYELENS
ncbi:hypothetical protein [Agathobacter rectalis]|jgi:hypothetical protein|uniref:Uncharacterized protein n=1 Tax=Agathobacter rectalis TaxID=39491 RepID=A0A3E4YKY5_9FIRM|nr:hypothetical protein [Agathobacter rectalis]MCB7108280.1 hypothetical protein [Agathobacter rectalis]MCG4811842.1 hypothetical protein [Agathobacter rectalis]RGM75408.1 hypothetical protein DXB99_02490 [Agathobacter rectalis]